MGRVGAMAIGSTHRCRWFCFCFAFVLLLFDCCISLLLPSIYDDVREFLATFGNGERGGVFYIPLSSLKNVDSVYASQHYVAFVLGATQTNKNQFSCIKIRALDTIQREYIIKIIYLIFH